MVTSRALQMPSDRPDQHRDEQIREADRRAFLERASQMAMTAPAAALLLAASQRQAMAAQYGSNGNGKGNK
jgi:hypothetical protein